MSDQPNPLDSMKKGLDSHTKLDVSERILKKALFHLRDCQHSRSEEWFAADMLEPIVNALIARLREDLQNKEK
jgi:hypothetical protein